MTETNTRQPLPRPIEMIREALMHMHNYCIGRTTVPYMSIPADRSRDADLILGEAIDELEAVRVKAAAFEWIQQKLRVAWKGYKPPTDGRDEIQEMYGNMHVIVDHADSFERYITSFKCNDKQGEIARQNALLLWFIGKFEGESGMGASEWGQHREFRDALRAVGRVTDADILEEEYGSRCP